MIFNFKKLLDSTTKCDSCGDAYLTFVLDPVFSVRPFDNSYSFKL